MECASPFLFIQFGLSCLEEGGVEEGQGLCVCCAVCPRCGNAPCGGGVISPMWVDEKAPLGGKLPGHA